ncbi:MAG: type III-B CRISPR module RAMP protein Cmr4 [Deltaproteobacteria bacterium]|nr:type III-B CRISPR module RAMP protein Cmr4 [Deltaproteobacteria bacterium]
MYKSGTLMLMKACTPVHPGAAEGVGAIDLPIQRETSTDWPIIQSGTQKGAMRDAGDIKANNDAAMKAHVKVLFGPDKSPDHAGALGICDAQVLLFPVRSLKGVYALVTCPMALARFRQNLEALSSVSHTLLSDPVEEVKLEDLLQRIGQPAYNKVKTPKQPDGRNPAFKSPLLITKTVDNQEKDFVVLGQCAWEAEHDQDLYLLGKWLQDNFSALTDLMNHLALVSDDDFTDFVKYSTEVITRNRIDDTKGVVEEGGLWTEEHLPRETVLYAPIFAAESLDSTKDMAPKEVIEKLKELMPDDNYFWAGGDTTVGRGLLTYCFK